MSQASFTSYFDVAQLVLYLFWIFFFGLIWYLARENRREGYPLVADRGIIEGWQRVPEPKTYLIAGGGEVSKPDGKVSPQDFNGERLQGHGGSAYEPTGNPLLAGMGPGSWADRDDVPNFDIEGHPSIRPLRLCDGFDVSGKDPDPRGMTVVDARGETAGTVRDLWLDVPEALFRYLELEVPAAGGTRRVMLPVPFARITRDGVKVHALLASQFADVPPIKADDRITRLEEERVASYYGAGLLYAEPGRAEPLV